MNRCATPYSAFNARSNNRRTRAAQRRKNKLSNTTTRMYNLFAAFSLRLTMLSLSFLHLFLFTLFYLHSPDSFTRPAISVAYLALRFFLACFVPNFLISAHFFLFKPRAVPEKSRTRQLALPKLAEVALSRAVSLPRFCADSDSCTLFQQSGCRQGTSWKSQKVTLKMAIESNGTNKETATAASRD